ncbi:hypothetical protein AAHA92_10989 [Salvia divinorum]|uniref:DUF674 family protein n=1 Tax=Salvia divinorum TaxID=28513 RepID=A0ABD1HX91_SALDI
MCDGKEAEFSLKVMINKEKTKVLFAEADSHFIDILLSFLTLPLGRIIKVLHKHYGDETPTIGSLNNLYHNLANLDTLHFTTEAAKQILLNPTSSFEDEIKQLKLDITDSPPNEYFKCTGFLCLLRFRSISMYLDNVKRCYSCGGIEIVIEKEEEVLADAASGDGVFTMDIAPYIIFDDLQIFPNETGLLGIISIVGIADMDKAEPIKVTFGFSEIVSLLKASLISQTPLSDIILSKTRGIKNSVFESETSLNQIENEQNPNSKKKTLKVVIQKSTGGVEHLLTGKTCVKAIDNLYRSTTDLIDCKYFKSPDMKKRLIEPNVAHGCISDNHIFPLTQKTLPDPYHYRSSWSSSKFPNGKGSYLKGPQTYQITDDLTVTPFCIFSILSNLNKQKIHVSDVKEVEMQIGLKEGLSILKASLTSTSALSDALLNNVSIKQPKTEH